MRAALIVAITVVATTSIQVMLLSALGTQTAPPPGADIASLRSRLEDIEAQLLASGPVHRAAVPAAATGAVHREQASPVPQEAIEAAVAAWMQSRTSPAAGKEFEPQRAFEGLLAGDSTERARIWNAAREAGAMDKLLAVVRARAEASPGDPEAQLQLADAYLQRGRRDPALSSRERGEFVSLADQAFDKVLELNTDHWEARYQKAVSLTFWPDFLGKGPESVRQFETLLAVQGRQPPNPRHANTFLFLGNLYSQRGEFQKAAEVWARGAAQFPGDTSLRDKVRGK
ncbi:MAG: hypothetical protein WAT39_23220 [Planctomycetota bacterium]